MTLLVDGYVVIGCLAAAIVWAFLVMEGVTNEAPLLIVMSYCLTLGLLAALIAGLLWPLALIILAATALRS